MGQNKNQNKNRGREIVQTVICDYNAIELKLIKKIPQTKIFSNSWTSKDNFLNNSEVSQRDYYHYSRLFGL